MKKIIVFLLLHAAVLTSRAQHNISLADSLPVIDLQEVSVSSIKKSAQQQLVSFFKTNNASTLEDILGRLPEVSLIRRGAYGMEPSIRYFNGGQINVLVDGMQIHGACTDKMDPVTIYIEPVNLQNLQVQTSANGFLNGSATGGTVNMKMAEPDYLHSNKLTGIFNSGYQTAANSFYESLRLNYSAGKWAVGASGTYRNSKNYRSGGGAVIPFSQYEKVNYSLSVKFQHDKYTYFKAAVLADDGWNIGYAALPMDVGYAAARIVSVSMHKENNAKRLYKWQTKLYANSVRHFMDDTKRPFVPMHMDMPGESNTIGIFTEGEIKINRQQRVTFRVDAASTFLKASMTMYQAGQLPMYMLTWPDNRKNQTGASVSWLWQPDSLLQLKLSSRIDLLSVRLVSKEAKDQVSIFDNAFKGRSDLLKNMSVQVSKKLSRRLKLTASIGYTERMPTATELFGFYLFNASDGYDYIGNPKLKTERALLADVAVLYSWQRSRVQLTGYCSKVNNMIAGTINPALSTMTIGANGVKSFVSIPYAMVAGAEASGFFNPVPGADITTTLRYTVARDNNNAALPFVAPVKNITAVRYQPKRFSIQLESEAAFSQNQVSKQYGEDATDGFVLLHCRLGYNTSIFKNSVELQAGVENVFDKKYHEHLDWGNIARPGRNIYVQLKVALNN